MDPQCILIAFVLFEVAQGASWSYEGNHGPSHWAATFPLCGGSSQSPIDVPDSSSTVFDGSLVPFTLNGFQTPRTYKLKNNGHSVQMDIMDATSVAGGNLGNTFNTAQLHFHWGNTSSVGSEHTLNGQSYPMELHIVNYNTKYESIAEAVDKADGLAVLGFWFTVSSTANSNYNPLLSQFGSIKFKDQMANATGVNIRNMLPSSLNNYYRYKGSLTTPACFESVTWTLFESTIPISESQLQQFRSLSEEKTPSQHNLVNNFRPVQNLNNRQVSRSFVSGSPRTISGVQIVGCLVFLSYSLSKSSI